MRRHLAIVALGAALFLPTLRWEFLYDDYAHLAALYRVETYGIEATPLDLFRFTSGDPAVNARLVREGILPWWTDLHIKFAFFRPVTSLTHLLDKALWGLQPAGYHATNLALFALLLLVASALYRRLAPTPRAATLALFVYAVADAHAVAVGWIANRNALVATLLALLALLFWDGHHRGRGRWRAPAAVALFALALGAGEAALGGLLLVAGYEALGLPGGPAWSPRRLASLLPFLLVGAAYIAVYKLGGYGAGGSAMYVDPTADPAEWLAAASVRVPLLAAGALWGFPVDAWFAAPAAFPALVAAATVLVVLAALLFRPTLARHRAVAAMALGGALALLPLASTLPMSRLLLLPGFGAALLLGAYLDDHLPLRTSPRLHAAAAAVLAARHVALAPLLLLATEQGFHVRADGGRLAVLAAPWPGDLPSRDVFFFNQPDELSLTYARGYLRLAGRPEPRRTYLLNHSAYPATLRREDARALVLRLRCRGMLSNDFERLYRRAEAAPFVADAGEFRATVLESGRDGPTEVRFDFRRDLEDGGYLFMAWDGDRYQAVRPPPPGEAIELPAVARGFGRVKAPAPHCPHGDR